jgi:hypothetical protein
MTYGESDRPKTAWWIDITANAGKHTSTVTERVNMSHGATRLVVLLLSLTALAACTRLAKRESDPIMGDFEGTFTPQGGQAVKAEAKVIADENNKYRVVILYPAATDTATRIELTGRARDGEILILNTDWTGKAMVEPWRGTITITKDSLQIAVEGAKGGKAEMKRVERKSPTLGAKPPAGAVVLLPFEEGQVTNLDQWTNKEWICQPDGSIQVHRGHNWTKERFGSFKLHLEFYVPFLPAERGAARGNSGVYLQNCYEILVLDSFGEPLSDRACGAIAGRKSPSGDAVLPPGQWQAFDIDFRAPQFDEISGQQTQAAVVTVLLNGVKIHDAVQMTGMTSGALSMPDKKGPLRLQDHNDPVRFRNIWLVEKK